jgi:dTMP kinase
VPGRLIVIEGVDGAGKSTLARALAQALGAHLTSEPFDEAVRKLLGELPYEGIGGLALPKLEGNFPPLPWRGAAAAFLLVADRVMHLAREVVPLLEGGRDVVCDRYYFSTYAYQGFGEGLPLGLLRACHDTMREAFGDVVRPHLAVILRIPPDVAHERLAAKSRREGYELSDPRFMARVSAGYEAMPALFPDQRFLVLDGRLPVAELVRAVEEELKAIQSLGAAR